MTDLSVTLLHVLLYFYFFIFFLFFIINSYMYTCILLYHTRILYYTYNHCIVFLRCKHSRVLYWKKKMLASTCLTNESVVQQATKSGIFALFNLLYLIVATFTRKKIITTAQVRP